MDRQTNRQIDIQIIDIYMNKQIDRYTDSQLYVKFAALVWTGVCKMQSHFTQAQCIRQQIERQIDRDRQTDRDRQLDRQIDRQIYIYIDRQTDRDRQIDSQMHRQIYRQMCPFRLKEGGGAKDLSAHVCLKCNFFFGRLP